MSLPDSRVTDPLAEAEGLIERIGGFLGNSADELAPAATALALIAIAHELRLIREGLADRV